MWHLGNATLFLASAVPATRHPRLLFPRLPFLQREPRVCYSCVCDSRVCYSRDANSRVCDPRVSLSKPASTCALGRVPSSVDFGPFGNSGDLGECSRYPLDFLFSLIMRVISLSSYLTILLVMRVFSLSSWLSHFIDYASVLAFFLVFPFHLIDLYLYFL